MSELEIIKRVNGPSDRSHIFMLGEKEVGHALTFRVGDEQLIINFEITPTYMNKGYGRLFYQEFEREWENLGVQNVIAKDVNVDAVEFWRKMGFIDTGCTVDGKHPIYKKFLQTHTC